jgi:predicted Fe-Mo cluster-binding NifX family protein
MMKRVALPVGSPGLDEKVNAKFGRADFILLVDPDSMKWESLENPAKDAGSGAGIQVAQLLSDRKVTDVICGEFGPKAQNALNTAGIAMHRCGSRTTVREALNLLKSGKLATAGASGRRTVREAVLGGLGRGEGQGRGGEAGLGAGGGGRGRGFGRGGGRGRGRGR